MRGVGPRDRFHPEHVLERAAARAAVLLGHEQPHQAKFSHFGHGGARKLFLLVQVVCYRDDLALRKLVDRLLEDFLLFCQTVRTAIGGACSLGGGGRHTSSKAIATAPPPP